MFRVLKILLPFFIIGIGIGGYYIFVSSKPTITRQKSQIKVPKVEAMPIDLTNATVTVSAMGTVVPSRKITLQSQVSGEVVKIANKFTPGGKLQKKETVLRIDPRDYEIELQKKRSVLAKAKAEFKLEQGRQDIARQELEMFEQGSNLAVAETEFALRKPQLEQARAELKSAEAEVAKAELDLSRTKIKAPFNALVTERNVNLGSQVGVQDDLATLVDIDNYWIQASVPVDSLRFLKLESQKGSRAIIRSQSKAGKWTGRALRLTGQVDEKTRMATLIITVSDPLNLKENSTPLMLSDYVNVSVQGSTLENVFALPRKALRDNNTVWVANENRLDIRDVQIVWKDREYVYIEQGLTEEDMVVVSDISTPVQGMQLSIVESGIKE